MLALSRGPRLVPSPGVWDAGWGTAAGHPLWSLTHHFRVCVCCTRVTHTGMCTLGHVHSYLFHALSGDHLEAVGAVRRASVAMSRLRRAGEGYRGRVPTSPIKAGERQVLRAGLAWTPYGSHCERETQLQEDQQEGKPSDWGLQQGHGSAAAPWMLSFPTRDPGGSGGHS